MIRTHPITWRLGVILSLTLALLATATVSADATPGTSWDHAPPGVWKREVSLRLEVTGPAHCATAVATNAVCGRQNLMLLLETHDGRAAPTRYHVTERRGNVWVIALDTRHRKGVLRYRFVASHETCKPRVHPDGPARGELLATRSCRWTTDRALPSWDGWYEVLITTGPVGWNTDRVCIACEPDTDPLSSPPRRYRVAGVTSLGGFFA